MARDLAAELVDALDAWQDALVAVRVVSRNDALVAVFLGRLLARTSEKGLSLFWPIELDSGSTPGFEKAGVYAHPELLSEVRVHVGQFIVEFTQPGVTINVRRLAESVVVGVSRS